MDARTPYSKRVTPYIIRLWSDLYLSFRKYAPLPIFLEIQYFGKGSQISGKVLIGMVRNIRIIYVE